MDSNTTLFTIGRVAEDAGIARQTLYSWLGEGLVSTRYDVRGSSRTDTPVFTNDERKAVIELAEERREAFSALRLASAK